MFQNREEAGLLLVHKLSAYKKKKDVIVVAIPRGGVVVGKQIAETLMLPLTIIIVKKLRAPQNPELAVGALAGSNTKFINWDVAFRSGVSQDYLDKEIEVKRKEVEERVKKFRIENLESKVGEKQTIILVDDGIATGATVLAAIKYIKNIKPKTQNPQPAIILAVPVIAKETYNRLQSKVEKIVALEIPESFGAVGEFYKEFPQVTDEQVMKLL